LGVYEGDLAQAKTTLPFGDTRDFEEQQKGFIAPMKQLQIKADAGQAEIIDHVYVALGEFDLRPFQHRTAACIDGLVPTAAADASKEKQAGCSD
jgi:hypothetical protein